MATATTSAACADAIQKDADRVVLHRVPWNIYIGLRDAEANRHARMAYYHGTLELRSPRYRREKYAARLSQLVKTLAEVLDISCTESCSTTFRREGGGAGRYSAIASGECLPMLTPARTLEALALCRGVSESRWGRLPREWVLGLTPRCRRAGSSASSRSPSQVSSAMRLSPGARPRRWPSPADTRRRAWCRRARTTAIQPCLRPAQMRGLARRFRYRTAGP